MNEVGNRLYRLLRQYWEVGVGISVATAFFFTSLDRIKMELLIGPLQGGILISLLIATTIRMLAYMHATLNELEMLHEYSLLAALGRTSWYALPIVAIIAVSFGALIAFTADILIYSSIAVVLQVADCVGGAIVQRLVFLSSKTLPQTTEDKPAPPSVIFEYYLYKPITIRNDGMLIGFFLALVLALVAFYKQDSLLKMLASVTVIMTICIGEIIMAVWRRWRDRQLT